VQISHEIVLTQSMVENGADIPVLRHQHCRLLLLLLLLLLLVDCVAAVDMLWYQL
jgi:hypothetical protein